MCTLEHKALSTSLGMVQSASTLLRTQACRDNGERKQSRGGHGMAPRGRALLRPACSHLPVLRAHGKLESLLKGCL